MKLTQLEQHMNQKYSNLDLIEDKVLKQVNTYRHSVIDIEYFVCLRKNYTLDTQLPYEYVLKETKIII